VLRGGLGKDTDAVIDADEAVTGEVDAECDAEKRVGEDLLLILIPV
jgi:hypothetical protein